MLFCSESGCKKSSATYTVLPGFSDASQVCSGTRTPTRVPTAHPRPHASLQAGWQTGIGSMPVAARRIYQLRDDVNGSNEG